MTHTEKEKVGEGITPADQKISQPSIPDLSKIQQALAEALAGLIDYRQFVCYRIGPDPKHPGKLTKVPCDAFGTAINALDPSSWVSAEVAIQSAQLAQSSGLAVGVAFVFTETDPFWFLDIDNALQDDGTWSPLATTLCGALPGCAIEVSASGHGLHVFGSGDLGAHSKKNVPLNLELYSEKRFVALTGTNAQGDVRTPIQPQIAEWLTTYYFKPRDRVNDPDWTDTPADEWRGPTDDDDLIRRACASRSAAAVFNGKASFKDIWTANADVLAKAYPSSAGKTYDASSADMALVMMLMFWTGRNCERVERLMRRSALVREKWDFHKSYLYDTLTKAKTLSRDVCQDKDRAPVQGLTANGSVLTIGNDRSLSRYDPLPHTTEGGRPLKTAANFQAIVEQLGATIRYNVDKNTPEIIIPGMKFLRDTEEEAKRAFLKTVCAWRQLPADDLDDWIILTAQANPYSPFQDYVKRKEWDGQDHLATLCATLTVKDDKTFPDGRLLSRVLLQCFLTGVIAASFTPTGCAQQLVLVLQGAQGLGKSRWAAKLIPPELGVYLGDAKLDPHNKDDLIQALSHVITELSELDGILSRADLARLKAVFTALEIVVRLPYGRRHRRIIRRTGFIATVNRSDFLVDDTGNRRFGVISLAAVNADHTLDMQQVWAQVWAMWEAGHKPYLSSDELATLNESNERFQAISAVEDLLMSRLDWTANDALWIWRTVAEIVEDVGLHKEDRANVTKAGALLAQRGCAEKRSGGVRRRKVPPLLPLAIRLGLQS